ncbi:MAG: AmmeMemoRadiSam system radical SAM enzyme [Candidatus Aenigmarchaeota archaeon]|nr:AmmeMemoRadiSam system radical SAM enzyme [Candidatus Aenigmarchaeota archaeon]
MKEALFYEKLPEKKVRCQLCARSCLIGEGKAGFCSVRKNIEGKLFSLVYGKLCSIAVDPIEKKPFYHFLPGTRALSIATVGCNLACKFCQNFDISKPKEIFGKNTGPKEVVEAARKNNCQSIAYTYTEPTVFYEYALDVMKLAKRQGLKNVWVSNGYTQKEPIAKMSKYLDAVNVDIKGDEKVYSSLCLASLKPVLSALKEYKKRKVWIEITMLIIPGHNDSEKWMGEITEWVSENLGRETPLHISRFFPMYLMTDVPPTPLETLKKLHKVAKKNLDHVYLGNIPEDLSRDTLCASCGELMVSRSGYKITPPPKACKKCGKKLAGVYA